MHTVLLVDDSAFMRIWLKNILHKTNEYKVIAEASNGREALLEYDSHRPEVVIMDVAMDEMDGVQTLKHLIHLFPSVKVVMCSSLGQRHYIEESLRIGAKDFVVKPYFEKLVDILDKLVT